METTNLISGCVGIVETAVGGVAGVKKVSAPFLSKPASITSVILEEGIAPPIDDIIAALDLMGTNIMKHSSSRYRLHMLRRYKGRS